MRQPRRPAPRQNRPPRLPALGPEPIGAAAGKGGAVTPPAIRCSHDAPLPPPAELARKYPPDPVPYARVDLPSARLGGALGQGVTRGPFSQLMVFTCQVLPGLGRARTSAPLST